MRAKVFLLTVLLTLFISLDGRSQPSWHYPSTEIDFNSSDGDTSYYGEADTTVKTQSIWRVRHGNILYDYYPSGYMQAISTVKESGPYTYIDQHNLEHKGIIFRYDGMSKIYFDSSHMIAAIGSFKNGEYSGNWKFYDKQARLIKKSYPISFYSHSDYYDSLGSIIKQIDLVENPDGGVTIFKEVEFENGQKKNISNKGIWFAFITRYTKIIVAIILSSFFIRVFINQIIYIGEGGDIPLGWFFGTKYSLSEISDHMLAMFFIFWWKDTKPENRTTMIISKVLSLIFISTALAYSITIAVAGHVWR